MRTLLANATVITMNPARDVLDTDILIENGVIADMGPGLAGRPENAGAERVDLSGRIVIPGLIQSHMHVTQSLFRGLADEMERRYLRLRESMTRNIAEYHSRVGLMPYIVCIIDEFADLAATGPEAEKYVRLLAQKARACGIHLIVATQRPSVDVVAGVLKADFPCRLAYKTASAADSRTILDTGGAEKLLGRGDALYLDGRGRLLRLHGAYVADNDIRTLLEPWRGKAVPLLPEKPAEREKQTEIPVAGKQEPGIFRRLLGWWSSLKVRERKSIISGLSRLFNGIVGRRSRK